MQSLYKNAKSLKIILSRGNYFTIVVLNFLLCKYKYIVL